MEFKKPLSFRMGQEEPEQETGCDPEQDPDSRFLHAWLTGRRKQEGQGKGSKGKEQASGAAQHTKKRPGHRDALLNSS
jgi:hypothetical protein